MLGVRDPGDFDIPFFLLWAMVLSRQGFLKGLPVPPCLKAGKPLRGVQGEGLC